MPHRTEEVGEPTRRDPAEGGGHRETDPLEGKMEGMPSPVPVSTKQPRIAELARTAPDMAFTSLSHHIDVEFLLEACRLTRKDGAVGVDGQTAKQYAEHWEEYVPSLLDRFKSGTYRAPPVQRAYIPKGDGSKTRPIGIPTFEDKVLQRAVAMVLVPIYEQDFRDCSYGFRPARSAHDALQDLWQGLMRIGGGWVLEMDIRSCFDSLDHSVLRNFLDRRVRDGVIRRTIHKWLKAGVMEDGALTVPRTGSPQGGVISPLLANIYLHEVLDCWFEDVVRPRLRGPAFLIRYADDAVLVFREEGDARRVMDVLGKRFAKYGLELHPEKTGLLDFRRPDPKDPDSRAGRGGRPETFDLLGFTHYWGRSRKGRWVVKRKTGRDRFRRAVNRAYLWCRKHRHQEVRWQAQKLRLKLQGHYGYYGITGNIESLKRLLFTVKRIWRKWLSRRSQKAYMSWPKFDRLLARYPLPSARVVHSIYRHAAKP